MVGEKNVGLLTGQEVIALHIKPGEYSVRSSYQACFPADVTLRKGETLLIEAQTTDKGIYFKPAAYDKIINLVAGRPFKEIRY